MLYELSCLINPDFSQEQAGDFIQKLEGMLADGGKVIKKDSAKKIGLAYPINKQTSAFLLSIMFELSPEKMEELKNKLDKDSEIIRFLLIKTKIEKDRPPRIPQNAISEAGKDVKSIKENKETKSSDDTPVVSKAAGEKPAASKPKASTKKVEMEKIETELNKILNESQ